MASLLTPALVETVLITYRDVRNGTNKENPIPHFPLPSQYVSVILVYGALSLLPDRFDRVGTLIGWGFVVATALNVWTPSATITKTNAVNSATTSKA